MYIYTVYYIYNLVAETFMGRSFGESLFREIFLNRPFVEVYVRESLYSYSAHRKPKIIYFMNFEGFFCGNKLMLFPIIWKKSLRILGKKGSKSFFHCKS